MSSMLRETPRCSFHNRCDLATITGSWDNSLRHEGHTNTMTRRGPRLSTLLRQARQQQGLSMGELAELAGIHKAQVSRLESGETTLPNRDTLNRLAFVLEIEPARLHQAAGYLDDALPSLPIYLRSKYGELPTEAHADVERYVQRLQRKYGLDGPAPGEDELPEQPRTRTSRSTRGGRP
jgi:transcriptional regulator with XRE-family HTH domain